MKVIFILLIFTVALVNSDDNHQKNDEDRKIHPDRSNKKFIPRNLEELETEFWMTNAQNLLKSKIEKPFNTKVAKNIIFFLGDGMSVQTVAATRNLFGDENVKLVFEKFPTFGYSKTYCVDRQVSDSACTTTAYLNGVKSNYATIGVNGQVNRYDCEKELDTSTHTESIGKWASDSGKSIGLITTTRVTHASPAGLYAHTANRYWENDIEIESDGCNSDVLSDIAEQLVHGEIGKKLKVIMGGGRGEFLDQSLTDEEGQKGWRGDGKNLINEWLAEKNGRGNAKYIWSRPELMSIKSNETDFLLGLFESNHLQYQEFGASDINEPSLSEMVSTAIPLLQKEEKGFFLFVEGGRIDTAHHDTTAGLALSETVEFSNVITAALQMTSEEDTLIVVTADHAHTLTYNGYSDRNSDILGIAEDSDVDRMPYTTLNYANGPGYYLTYTDTFDKRIDISDFDFSDPRLKYAATVPLSSETHGADDVGVYANGPWSHLFSGTYEQNSIPFLMAYAAKIGYYSDTKTGGDGSGANLQIGISFVVVIAINFLIQFYQF